MRALRSLIIGLLLLTCSSVFGQAGTAKVAPVDSSQIKTEYALVFFSESRDHMMYVVNNPDGSFESDARHFSRKALNTIGDYRWILPVLNKLTASGYTIKSHSLTCQVGESRDTWQHVYVMERVLK